MDTHGTHRSLTVVGSGGGVPLAYWPPQGEIRGIALVSHGGGGHKLAPDVQRMAQAFGVSGLLTCAIDGPVHGERARDPANPAQVKEAFIKQWREGTHNRSMVDDWRAALDAMTQLPGLAHVPVGYVGLSMGAAYGIPLVEIEERIGAAVLGMWSANYSASAHLVASARAIRQPVLFVQKLDDEVFDSDGQRSLFDALGSSDKRLVGYPGPHAGFSDEQIEDLHMFLVRALRLGYGVKRPA